MPCKICSTATIRIASKIVNRDKVPMRKWLEYYEWSKAKSPNYDTRRPNREERQVQKLLAIFQMTYLGAPMIYYGDEVGMWGANDPCCRQPMVWEDLEHKKGKRTPDDEGVFDPEMFEHYRQLIHLRNSHPALQLGDYQTLLADDARELYVFSRSYQNQYIIVALNNSRNDGEIKLEISNDGEFVDRLERRAFFAKNNHLEFESKAKSGRILVR